MEELLLPSGITPDMERFFRQMFQEAAGQIITLRAVPTGDALLPGQIGTFGTDLYLVTLAGTKIKLAGTSWS